MASTSLAGSPSAAAAAGNALRTNAISEIVRARERASDRQAWSGARCAYSQPSKMSLGSATKSKISSRRWVAGVAIVLALIVLALAPSAAEAPAR